MISLKKYLDDATASGSLREVDDRDLFLASIAAYRSALVEMGHCSQDVAPSHEKELKLQLENIAASFSVHLNLESIVNAESTVRQQLQSWGHQVAFHRRQQTGEVKDMLLMMTRAAESVGNRDQKYGQHITDVTTRLQKIATLEDLTQIRSAIEKSASELKTSVEKMAAENKSALDQLRSEVSTYQAKLEAAEQIASCDSLTGLCSRLYVEGQIERRINSGLPFCVSIVDIDGFKQVNDDHGHLAGDDLLKQFAKKLKSACRSTDLIGRWGGDEFIILLYCGVWQAKAQCERLREWISGNYTVHVDSRTERLKVNASIGLAERLPTDKMHELLGRADAAMYQHKASSRLSRVAVEQPAS